MQAQVQAGTQAREQGEIELSVEELQSAASRTRDPRLRAQVLTQLGVSLSAADRLAEAQRVLESALPGAVASDRAPVELALGNVVLRRHDAQRASELYRSVVADAGADAISRSLVLAAQLNLARMSPDFNRLEALAQLFPRLEQVAAPLERGRAYLNLANQASDLFSREVEIENAALSRHSTREGRPTHGDRALQALFLSHRAFSAAVALGYSNHDPRLELEAKDGIAQLYEIDGRPRESLDLDRRAIADAAAAHVLQVQDILMRLEWRAGRLERALGRRPDAVASYLRAADHLIAIRQDLPLEDGNGRSTFRSVFRPVYNDLADLLLTDIDSATASERRQRLAAVTEVIEVARQAELQDFLGDRCSVESSRDDRAGALDSSVAVLYIAVLKSRVELILETASTLEHGSALISEPDLNQLVLAFRRELLSARGTGYRLPGDQLYRLIVAPFAARLAQAGIRYLVVVPDGALRLVPFAALHDDEHFLGERYAISSVIGLTLTNDSAGQRARQPMSLLLGLSEPGPVVGKLLSLGLVPRTHDTIVASRGGELGARSEPGNESAAVVEERRAAADSNADRALSERSLQRDLALPGVQTEIKGLSALARNNSLIDASFTLSSLRRELLSGKYDRLHIASHAFFGDSARDSFLLAYDDIIRMDDLQTLIAKDVAGGATLDLLTLSACDTAEGDDRAPLGFAGAAIKARARSVIGSLWAVNDAATQQFMRTLYSSLTTRGKADAVADAQRALLASGEFSHPYYWAPFSLIGDWR